MDYYEILGIQRSASGDEIKEAYHKMLKKYHPDNLGGKSERTDNRIYQINEAYETLSDPVRKRIYDETHFRQDTQPHGETDSRENTANPGKRQGMFPQEKAGMVGGRRKRPRPRIIPVILTIRKEKELLFFGLRCWSV